MRRRMWLFFGFVLCVQCGPLHAAWSPVRSFCELALETKNDLVSYADEVWASPYFMRLLVKNAEKMDPEHFGRFVRPSESLDRPRWWWRWTGGQRFTPIQALDERLIDAPARKISSRIWNRSLVPAGLVKIPIYFMMFSLIVVPPYEAAFEWLLEKRQEQTIVSHRDFYENLLKFDQRFKDLHLEVQKRHSNAETSLQVTRTLRALQVDYFQGLKIKPPSNYQEYASHPLFLHLSGLVKKGIQPEPGLVVPEDRRGKLSVEVLNSIFLAEHRSLVLQEEVLQEYVKDHFTSLSQTTTHETLPVTSSFWQKTLKQMGEGKISSEMALSHLQEDLRWRSLFDQWRSLGATRLSQGADGQWTSTPLTLEIIEQEILAD